MAGLDQRDMEILGAYADSHNRELYWNYLAHKQGNDGYGMLALGVVRSDNAPGATANIFADNQARRDGARMNERQWNAFGVDLMQADLARRQGQMQKHRPDLALNLPVLDVQRAHDETFRSHHINPNAWTPRELLDAARRHGGETEAEKVWTMMLDNSALGLSRMYSTSADIAHRYNDDKLDAASYLTRMGIARAEASQALPNTEPDRIGTQSDYAAYDARSDQWTRVITNDGLVTMHPVDDAGEIKELNETRQLRLQRQELREQFHQDDPYRNQPVIRSPFLLSDAVRTNPESAADEVKMTESSNQHHQALHQQCSAGVDELDRRLGRTPDESSACMKASLTALAATNDFDHVDHVLLSQRSGEVQAGQNVFIIQGALDDPAHRRAHMPTDQAISTPVETSMRELAQLDQRSPPTLDAQAQALQQTDQPHAVRTLGG